jgi:hypothetical protein
VRSGPVDLFGPAVRAPEPAKATPEESAATAAEAPGIDLTGPEPLPAQLEAEPDEIDAEPDRVEPEPEQLEAHPEPAESVVEPADVPAAPEPDAAGNEPVSEAPPIPDLDPEVERTQLTRRELRARRGAAPAPDDTPKHLPQMTAPVAVTIDAAPEPVEEVEIPAQAPVAPPEIKTEGDPVARRRSIVRLSVLLGILAVTSSVAVLTAGTL